MWEGRGLIQYLTKSPGVLYTEEVILGCSWLSQLLPVLFPKVQLLNSQGMHSLGQLFKLIEHMQSFFTCWQLTLSVKSSYRETVLKSLGEAKLHKKETIQHHCLLMYHLCVVIQSHDLLAMELLLCICIASPNSFCISRMNHTRLHNHYSITST